MQKWNLIYMESRQQSLEEEEGETLSLIGVTMRKLRKLKEEKKKKTFRLMLEGVRKCQTFLTSLCISASLCSCLLSDT